jgi:hypothetical protein
MSRQVARHRRPPTSLKPHGGSMLNSPNWPGALQSHWCPRLASCNWINWLTNEVRATHCQVAPPPRQRLRHNCTRPGAVPPLSAAPQERCWASQTPASKAAEMTPLELAFQEAGSAVGAAWRRWGRLQSRQPRQGSRSTCRTAGGQGPGRLWAAQVHGRSRGMSSSVCC